jgi:hypothetical protein
MAMSLRTPDWRQGWSNLHMFMQTCGEARGSFCGARTRCACPLPLARARGPRPQAPCDGSRVAPCPVRSGVEGLPGEKDRARQALRGTCARYPY